MVKERRCLFNPILDVEEFNVEADRHRIRRAASVEEPGRLLAATLQRGPDSGLEGADRVAIYFLAAYTGLRRGEIASLTKRSLKLDVPNPTVTASYNKHRRTDGTALAPSPR